MRSPEQLLAAGRVLACLLLSLLCPAGDLAAQALLKRGGIDVVDRRPGPFALDVGVGVAGLDGFGDSRFVLGLTPRLRLRRAAGTALDLTLPIVWIPDAYPDPWDDPCPPDLGGPCPFGDLFAGLRAESLEVGPSIFVAPSLEWTFRRDCCLQPAVFFGAGIRRDRGRVTEIPTPFGVLSYATESTTSPAVTFGAALKRPLTARTALRVEARGVTTFYDEMSVTAFDGSRAVLEGGSVTAAFLTVAVELGF